MTCRGMIESHNTLINDKNFHFDNIAVPQYEKEVKEMKEQGFVKEYQLSESIVSEKHKDLDSKCETIKSEIKDELYWFEHLEDKNKSDEEYNCFYLKQLED